MSMLRHQLGQLCQRVAGIDGRRAWAGIAVLRLDTQTDERCKFFARAPACSQ